MRTQSVFVIDLQRESLKSKGLLQSKEKCGQAEQKENKGELVTNKEMKMKGNTSK
jgi:hypothetical protein